MLLASNDADGTVLFSCSGSGGRCFGETVMREYLVRLLDLCFTGIFSFSTSMRFLKVACFDMQLNQYILVITWFLKDGAIKGLSF